MVVASKIFGAFGANFGHQPIIAWAEFCVNKKMGLPPFLFYAARRLFTIDAS